MAPVNNRMLDWQYMARFFHCGRNKALKILHQVPGLIYVGSVPMVSMESFQKFLDECNGEIKVEWTR